MNSLLKILIPHTSSMFFLFCNGSYSIVRISGFNEEKSGEASTIELSSDQTSSGSTEDDNLFMPSAVSRDEVAQVCVSALLDPNALNKSFYMSKQSGAAEEDNISSKFADLDVDSAR